MGLFRPARLTLLVKAGHPDIATRTPWIDGTVAAQPMRIGAAMLAAFGLQDDWLPASGVLPSYGSRVHVISNVQVQSSGGIVGLASGEVLQDTLDHTDPEIDGYQRRGDGVLLQKPRIRLEGKWLSLLLGNHRNHFHWLLMNLARVALLEADEMASLAGILIPAGLLPPHRESLNLAGLERHAPFRAVAPGESLSVKTLVLPWNIASGHGVNPAGSDYLRRLVPTRPSRNATRRLYLDRRASPLRRLLNEDEVVHAVQRAGVEIVQLEGLSLAEQAATMQDAALIVGPHGAGLTNMAFAHPGIRVVEIMPDGVLNWCYRHLAAACRHDYDCVIGRSHPHDGIAPLWAPWVASPTHVLSAIG